MSSLRECVWQKHKLDKLLITYLPTTKLNLSSGRDGLIINYYY